MKMVIRALVVASMISLPSFAFADDLEGFFRQLQTGPVQPQMFDDQGRYITQVGSQSMVMGKTELLNLYQTIKQSGAKTEVVSLKLSDRLITGDVVSVVVTAKVRQVMGNSKSEGEVVSHEIVKKVNGRWVSIFTLARQ